MDLVAVLIPDGGDWRVLVPDLPGCEARGASVPDAIEGAEKAVLARLEAMRLRGDAPPVPREFEAVRQDTEWGKDNGVDIATASLARISTGPRQRPI
jgi:predicted RNase H-like HicB family nuclease